MAQAASLLSPCSWFSRNAIEPGHGIQRCAANGANKEWVLICVPWTIRVPARLILSQISFETMSVVTADYRRRTQLTRAQVRALLRRGFLQYPLKRRTAELTFSFRLRYLFAARTPRLNSVSVKSPPHHRQDRGPGQEPPVGRFTLRPRARIPAKAGRRGVEALMASTRLPPE